MAKVLIADDALFMRMMIKNLLVEQGHEIIGEAHNGEEAVHLYKLLKPDLVTLDITMPVMDGLVAMNEIRKLDSKAKVIMCSAMGQQGMIVEAIRNGAKDFIVKPFEKDRVVEAINKVLL